MLGLSLISLVLFLDFNDIDRIPFISGIWSLCIRCFFSHYLNITDTMMDRVYKKAILKLLLLSCIHKPDRKLKERWPTLL